MGFSELSAFLAEPIVAFCIGCAGTSRSFPTFKMTAVPMLNGTRVAILR